MNVKMSCVLAGVLLVGCGSSDGSGTGPGGGHAPTVHQLDNGPKRVAVSSSLIVMLGSLPSGATVTYSIVDMPTGFGDDSMDFAISSDSAAHSGGTIVGYGIRSNVSSTGATTQALPADDYDLVALCKNIADDCFFTSTISATF